MKKKFSLWLNIATICLCLCAIAVGVYSLKTAMLNITGTIGFTMHEAVVEVSGKIYNVAQLDSATGGYERIDVTINKAIMGAEKSDESITTTNLDVGSLEFYKGYDMIFDLEFKNLNDKSVYAKFNLEQEIANVSVVTGDLYTTLPYAVTITPKGSVRLYFALHLSNESVKLNNTSFKITAEFEQLSHEQGEYYVENGRLYVEYGYYPTTDTYANVYIYDTSYSKISGATAYGDNLGKPIRWVAYSADGTTALTSVTSVPTSGTYYFISEYVLTPGMAFNSNYSTATDGKNPNDYEVSEVRKYINGSFVTDYQLSALIAKVTKRTLPTETITSFASDVDSKYETAGTAINNCTDSLWLISKTEYDLVTLVMGKNIAYYPSQADQIYNTSPTQYGAYWWLRSPYASSSSSTYFGYRNGGSSSNYVYSTGPGVRAAFQISI